MKKTLLIPALALTMAGTVLFATNQVNAQGTDRQTTLVQKLADKFGLNKDEVQAVFDQEKTDRQADRQNKFGARLDQLVKDGKITEAQKQLILDKFKTIEADRAAKMEQMKSMTPDQRKAAMKADHEALQKWASDNGIDLKSVFGGFGHRMGGHKNGF
jgi:competence protein ComGC